MPSLKVGDLAPDFTLASDGGTNVSLKDLRGRKVILYFYPKDDTPGCTKQACAYRDSLGKFDRRNAVILGVSRDDGATHQAFKKKFSLNFPLLCDEDTKVHKLYGAWGEKTSYGKSTIGVIRTTAVIDEKGIVVSLEKGVDAEKDAGKRLKELES